MGSGDSDPQCWEPQQTQMTKSGSFRQVPPRGPLPAGSAAQTLISKGRGRSRQGLLLPLLALSHSEHNRIKSLGRVFRQKQTRRCTHAEQRTDHFQHRLHSAEPQLGAGSGRSQRSRLYLLGPGLQTP